MDKPPCDPAVADVAPEATYLTGYDEQHLITYLRLLDAEADLADWQDVARLVLHRDPAVDPERTRQCWMSHLARAHWMTSHGFRHLLRGGAPN
ncbi:DNA -binding domain-containing protein [Komagataeibacter europaeus]|uniref:DNA -binding domain-containing protein n=1 Tax=Komagataeibacter europaeus TaxID=33995 RepID=UPI000237DF01|nr:DUF2285 domain-containing protein [Komagataeibacter europaeus]